MENITLNLQAKWPIPSMRRACSEWCYLGVSSVTIGVSVPSLIRYNEEPNWDFCTNNWLANSLVTVPFSGRKSQLPDKLHILVFYCCHLPGKWKQNAIKESMYIKWEKPDLNQQVKHINLTLSL